MGSLYHNNRQINVRYEHQHLPNQKKKIKKNVKEIWTRVEDINSIQYNQILTEIDNGTNDNWKVEAEFNGFAAAAAGGILFSPIPLGLKLILAGCAIIGGFHIEFYVKEK